MYILYYIHEHTNEIPEQVWWDDELEEYCTNDKVLFEYQFQIGGWSKRVNNEWLAQVGYGSEGERVILERKNGQRLHVYLTELVCEDDESQFWKFERVRSKDFYKLPPAPAEPSSVDLGALSLVDSADGSDKEASAAARS
jgi:hypothetical protein